METRERARREVRKGVNDKSSCTATIVAKFGDRSGMVGVREYAEINGVGFWLYL